MYPPMDASFLRVCPLESRYFSPGVIYHVNRVMKEKGVDQRMVQEPPPKHPESARPCQPQSQSGLMNLTRGLGWLQGVLGPLAQRKPRGRLVQTWTPVEAGSSATHSATATTALLATAFPVPRSPPGDPDVPLMCIQVGAFPLLVVWLALLGRAPRADKLDALDTMHAENKHGPEVAYSEPKKMLSQTRFLLGDVRCQSWHSRLPCGALVRLLLLHCQLAAVALHAHLHGWGPREKGPATRLLEQSFGAACVCECPSPPSFPARTAAHAAPTCDG